jgi:hypothetical protein
MEWDKSVRKLANWVKINLDAVVLLVDTIIFLILGILSVFAISMVLYETTFDILNALSLILMPALINVIGIKVLTGRKRSAIIPFLIILGHCLVCVILLYVNILISVLLGLNIIAAIFCMRKRPIIPRFKTRNGLYSLLLTLLIMISPIIIYYGTSAIRITLPGVANPNFKVSFYCEYYDNNTFTAQHLEVLGNHSSRIFLAINETQIYNNSLVHNLTIWFNAANVSVYAWLLLDQAKGYWAADANVLEIDALVTNFTVWAKSNNLEYDGIMIDSEPTFQRMQALQEQLSSFNIFGALADLRRTAKSQDHDLAAAEYEEIVTTIQQSGYEAMVVGFPLPVDDLADTDDTLQRLMGVSTMPPYNWNYSSFMIYRSTYKELSTIDFGSYMVYSYARTIWKYFGKNSSVSLSRSGSELYNSIDDLIQDALIVKNVGFDETILISFERIAQTFGISGLTELLAGVEATQQVSFDYNAWCGYSRLLWSLIDRVEII